jgi:hypothetical protein
MISITILGGFHMEPMITGKKITSGLVILTIIAASFTAIFMISDSEEVAAAMPGWRAEVRITNFTTNFSGKDMAVRDNFVHIVWAQQSNGNYSIFYRRSMDYGITWDREVELYNSFYPQSLPHIAVWQDHVHVVWDDGEGLIRYINSNDNGENWNPIQGWDWTSYPANPGPDAMFWPNVAADEFAVMIVGNAMSAGDTVFKRSLDNGTSWQQWFKIGNFSFPWPHMTIDKTDSLVHVTCGYLNFGSSQWVDHFYSYDYGQNWYEYGKNPILIAHTSEEILTHYTTTTYQNIFYLYYSKMDMSGTIHLGTFQNYTYDSNPEIWHGPYQVLTNGEGHFAVDIFDIVWGERDMDSNRQLFFNETDQITDYSSNCTYPLIEIEGSLIHILWEDDRDGSTELYYTHNITTPDPPPGPPRNFDAIIEQGSPTNVLLTWDASIDDGSGDDDVSEYLVYRSSTGVNGTYEFRAGILADDSPSYSMTDFGAGDGDLLNYFYIVRAKDTNGNEEQNEIKVGKVVSYLVNGWNLFSIPLIQGNTSKDAALTTIAGNYNTLVGYHAGKSRPWLNWHKDKPKKLNNEIEVNNEEGYYIRVTTEDILVTAGRVPTSTQISLKAGWNLVGYPSLTHRTRDEALASISGNYNKVEFYNTTSDKEEGLGPDDMMYPHYGYWIHATSDCLWDVSI